MEVVGAGTVVTLGVTGPAATDLAGAPRAGSTVTVTAVRSARASLWPQPAASRATRSAAVETRAAVDTGAAVASRRGGWWSVRTGKVSPPRHPPRWTRRQRSGGGGPPGPHRVERIAGRAAVAVGHIGFLPALRAAEVLRHQLGVEVVVAG